MSLFPNSRIVSLKYYPSDITAGPDSAGAQRVLQAMLKMKKIIIADLQRAYDGQ